MAPGTPQFPGRSPAGRPENCWGKGRGDRTCGMDRQTGRNNFRMKMLHRRAFLIFGKIMCRMLRPKSALLAATRSSRPDNTAKTDRIRVHRLGRKNARGARKDHFCQHGAQNGPTALHRPPETRSCAFFLHRTFWCCQHQSRLRSD